MAIEPIDIDMKMVFDRTELDEILVDLKRGVAMKRELEEGSQRPCQRPNSDECEVCREEKRFCECISRLNEQLAQTKAQLESTEKAYDMALQQSLELQDQLSGTAVHDAEAGEPLHVHLSGSETVESKRVGHVSVTNIVPTPPRPEMDAVIIDDANAPHKEPTVGEALLWYDMFGPGADDPDYSPSSYPKVISGLRRINQDVNRRRREAQGDRAKMKDTLGRTQNACRKYKARLALQKSQLDALQDTASAAFPLFTALNEALGGFKVEIRDGTGLVVRLPWSSKLEQQCRAFHNKFNKAAETLIDE